MTTVDAPKVAVIYYSSTGNVHELAKAIGEGAEQAGARVRLRRTRELVPPEAIAQNPARQVHAEAAADVPEAALSDLTWADAVVFGSPSHYGSIASQLKQFIDTTGGLWQAGKLADKVYSGFTSSSTHHGGHEIVLASLYNSVHHFGGIVVSPGYTDPVQLVTGNPYGTSHVSGAGVPVSEDTRAAGRHQGRRVAEITGVLKAGKATQSED